jgi:hypothetical protein
MSAVDVASNRRTLTAHLRPSAAAPQLARFRVRSTCAQAGFSTTLVHEAAIVVGELVRLCLRHSRDAIDLAISISDAGVELRVRSVKTTQHASHTRYVGVGTNRSIELVRRLSNSWGLEQTATERSLWAFLAVIEPSHVDAPRSMVEADVRIGAAGPTGVRFLLGH